MNWATGKVRCLLPLLTCLHKYRQTYAYQRYSEELCIHIAAAAWSCRRKLSSVVDIQQMPLRVLQVCSTVNVMKRILELAVVSALCGLVAGCGTSGVSLFGDDETPASVADTGNNSDLAGNLPPANNTLPANVGRYPPPQRYYELTLDGFPAGTRCEVTDALGRVWKRGTGRRISISITGYPSQGEVVCSTGLLSQFVIDTNKWVFTQPRRPGLQEGDVEKVFVEVEYSLTNAKLTPVANMTMNTSAGTFTDRIVLDNLAQ